MLVFNNYISFQNFNWWFVMAGAIFWLVVVFLTYSNQPKYVVLKALLWLFAVGSLVLLLLNPQIKIENKSQNAILLTTENAIRNFESINEETKNVFTLNRLKLKTEFDSVININHLLHLQKEVTTLEIIGNGLTVDELENLPKIPVKFNLLNENEVSGHIEMKYPKTVFVSEPFSVNLLLGNDTTAHFFSTTINADTLKIKNKKIDLKYQMAVSGKHLININLFNKYKKLVDVVAMPIEVIEKQTANILMLNGYPFFENQHLKTFIGKQGHQLWVRTQATLDKYRYDYINTKPENEITINRKFLKQIDLLIIDGAALKALNKEEYDAINKQRKNGLGILLRMDENYELATYNWGNLQLGVKRIANSTRDFVSIIKDGKTIEVEVFSYQNNLFSTKLIEGTGAGKMLSTNKSRYQPFGITNIKNSYLFNLKGDSLIYNWIWGNIIEASIPQKIETKNVWQLKNELANIDDSYVEVELITNEAEPVAYLKTSFEEDWLRLSLQQSYYNNEMFTTTFWPKNNGWYYFKTDLDTLPQHLYIGAKNENILLRKNRADRLKSQLIRYSDEGDTSSFISSNIKTKKPAHLFWNCLVFVLCLTLIFIIEKFL